MKIFISLLSHPRRKRNDRPRNSPPKKKIIAVAPVVSPKRAPSHQLLPAADSSQKQILPAQVENPILNSANNIAAESEVGYMYVCVSVCALTHIGNLLLLLLLLLLRPPPPQIPISFTKSWPYGPNPSLGAQILALRPEPHHLGLDQGLLTGIWTSKLRFWHQYCNLAIQARIWALRLGFESRD